MSGRPRQRHEYQLAALGDPKVDDELRAAVLADPRLLVLLARVTPLLLDPPPHLLEIVAVPRVRGVERNRLAFDASAALATAARSTGAAAQGGQGIGTSRWGRRWQCCHLTFGRVLSRRTRRRLGRHPLGRRGGFPRRRCGLRDSDVAV